jgi:hypothetical protein
MMVAARVIDIATDLTTPLPYCETAVRQLRLPVESTPDEVNRVYLGFDDSAHRCMRDIASANDIPRAATGGRGDRERDGR